MERESFENDEVARLLNKSFVPIKVDREERPDVDRIYMNYVQATTGSGGWPLNVFITPDLEPVFGGTYWPGPTSNAPAMIQDQVGFLQILKKISTVWNEQEKRCRDSAKEILTQLREFAEEGNHNRAGGGAEREGLELDLLEEAYQHFAGRYDKIHGGFSGMVQALARRGCSWSDPWLSCPQVSDPREFVLSTSTGSMSVRRTGCCWPCRV